MLIDTSQFVDHLYKAEFNFFAGVPCSYLAGLIKILSGNKRANYIPATREDMAIGLASGAYLAGKWPAVLMQNSGLGNSMDALTSLSLIYKIPVLLIISFRGYRGIDAPEHLVMGSSCLRFLKDVGIPYQVLKTDSFKESIKWASSTMKKNNIPAAIFIRKGLLSQ